MRAIHHPENWHADHFSPSRYFPERAHPIVLVFAIFAGVLIATTALRFAIWLPIAFLKSI
jgi:hypothetical protein